LKKQEKKFIWLRATEKTLKLQIQKISLSHRHCCLLFPDKYPVGYYQKRFESFYSGVLAGWTTI
jgi:hypothetical protein